MEGSCKVHLGESEGWFLLHSKIRQWRRSGSNKRSPFAPFANSALVNALLDESSALDDPKLGPNFSKCFFHTIVKNP